LYQFDLSLTTGAQIYNSRTLIKKMSTLRKLLLAPNGKIYHTNPDAQTMGVINYPNQSANNCGHNINILDISPGTNSLSLPKFVKGKRFSTGINDPVVDLGPDQKICQGLTTTLNPNGDDSYTYKWQDGSTEPSLIASQAGLYAVTVTNECGSAVDFMNIEIIDTKLVDLGDDIVITSTPHTLNAGSNGDFYEWQDGSTESTLEINHPGQYWVKVSNEAGCCQIDYINVSIYIFKNRYLSTLNLYPNPSTGLFILEEQVKDVLNNIELTIYDVLGRKLYYRSLLLDGKIEIDLTEYTEGMYFLHWASEENSGIFKMIVAR
jgi:hypothetical protein